MVLVHQDRHVVLPEEGRQDHPLADHREDLWVDLACAVAPEEDHQVGLGESLRAFALEVSNQVLGLA